jgi:uncharacterized membrane protein (DUF373 family)
VVRMHAVVPQSHVSRHRWLRFVELFEVGIYTVSAIFLVGCGILLFVGTSTFAAHDFDLSNPRTLVVGILDQTLLVFMVAELLHTVRITLRDRALAAEPFLIVGLIAGVRRILILTASNENIKAGGDFQVFWVEMVLLIALVLAMVISLFIWRRAFSRDDR